MSMLAGKVDFVIPHMGRPEMLVTTIESILAQNCPERVHQILVVTKNSEPLVVPAHPKLTILYRPDATSISEQRNVGASYGQSEWLAFLDADIQLAPDWLATCLKLMQEQPTRVVLTAMQKDAQGAPVTERIRTVLCNTKVDTVAAYLPGCNLLLRRSSHQDVGGFPEHLQTCEDSYYTERLGQAGELYCTSQTYYIHLGEDKSFAQSFKKEIWRSEYNLKSLSGRKVPLREWPSILLPFWVLLALLAMLLSSLVPSLFLPAVALLMLPVLLYSLRLYRLPHNTVAFHYLLLFYTVYFAARAVGTLAGVRFLLPRKTTL
ncbi:glycosyltransferase family A protein [Alkalimonas amylolytica]|uniref:Glycosyltransferase, GT2 family n=1 Tax=Alkalimonas amylolytica TaxID=152573 RepID=A0A1H4CCI9_ALKAM|nr:glycosyltransferase family A protein [Alkalimonas amylolytica]SEA57802.1 Glycosyltransferase, GT2 family [Alkalimonas amylolytica]